MPLALTQANIQAGFIKTGIYPYNRNLFEEIDFAPSFVTDRPNLSTEENVPAVSCTLTSRPNPDTEDNIPAVPSPGRTRPNPDTENNAPAIPSHTTSRTDIEDNSPAASSPVISRPIPDNQEDAPAASSLINIANLDCIRGENFATENFGPNNKNPPLSPSILDNTSSQNFSNVQPSTSAIPSVFSPEILRPFPKAPQRKTRAPRNKNLRFTRTRLKKRQSGKNMKQKKND